MHIVHPKLLSLAELNFWRTLERRKDQLKANVQSMAEKALQAPPPATQNLENKLDQMKVEMEGMVGKGLQARAGFNTSAGLDPLTI